MRTPSALLYGSDYTFDFGKGAMVRRGAEDRAVIVSSGLSIHEAVAACRSSTTDRGAEQRQHLAEPGNSSLTGAAARADTDRIVAASSECAVD
jgi:hypothetical protein